VGLGALPASLLFGLLWHTFSVEAAFLTGAALAISASALLILSRRPEAALRAVETGGQVSQTGCNTELHSR
jgi:hypothetical protein